MEMGEPTVTTVLLYSGGLDSYVAAALLTPDVLLHVDTGTTYGDVEHRHLTPPPGQSITHIRLRDLVQWERPDDLILPARNAHLVLAAAHHGDTIWLGATAGDRTHDKDQRFADTMTHLLGHMYAPQWWIPEGRAPTVELPINHLTKRELVTQYLNAGHPPDALDSNTFSCYHPTPAGYPCAACKPCIRKWVALTVNRVSVSFDASAAAERAAAEMATRGGEYHDLKEALEAR